MKTHHLTLYALVLSASFISCNKSSEADIESLQEMLESNSYKQGLYVGMEYQGGLIFYLDETGRHGLIAATEDLGPAPWGCFGTAITSARSFEDGYANTQAILKACPEAGIAARLCDQYVSGDDGKLSGRYSDWFMPSAVQFSLLVQNMGAAGFCGKTYWSSTEEPAGFQAAPVNLAERVNQHSVTCAESDPGVWGFFRSPVSKSTHRLVRPIRAF
jgi:hypothetical protein